MGSRGDQRIGGSPGYFKGLVGAAKWMFKTKWKWFG